MADTDCTVSKACTKCGHPQPISEFYSDVQKPDGKSSHCRTCKLAAHKEYAKRNPQKGPEAHRRWKERHAAELPQKRRAKYEQNRASELGQQRARYRANRETLLEKGRAHYRASLPYQRARAARYRQANRDAMLIRSRDYRAAHREHANAVSGLWAKRNRDRHNAHGAKRRAVELQATPKWADTERMILVFREAVSLSERTGIKHHVDHIVPLQHKLVCGLHCEDNLQAVDALTNRKKGNRHWPDMP